MSLKTLKTSVPMLQGQQVRMATTATERIRGSAHQAIRARIMARDAGICRCDECKASGALQIAHHVDHYVPLWAGGAESDSNRYAISRTCHDAKSRCEASMRARGWYDPSRCTCGRHATGVAGSQQ